MNQFTKAPLVKLVLLLLTGSLLAPSALFAEGRLSSSKNVYIAKSVYDFQRSLRGAKTWATDSKMRYMKGKWEEDGFTIEDLGPRAKVQKTVEEVKGKQRQAIRFNPFQEVRRYLQFEDVAPGSKLVLKYGIQISEDVQEVSYFDFRVVVGNRMIAELRIPVANGWTVETIPIGISGFLDREVAVTFEIFTESAETIFFSFSAEFFR